MPNDDVTPVTGSIAMPLEFEMAELLTGQQFLLHTEKAGLGILRIDTNSEQRCFLVTRQSLLELRFGGVHPLRRGTAIGGESRLSRNAIAMNLLIFLTHPEPTRSGYEKYLAPRHPELDDHHRSARATRRSSSRRGRHPDGVRAAGEEGFLPEHAEAEMGALARHRHRRHHRLALSRQGRDRHRGARHPRRADLRNGVPAACWRSARDFRRIERQREAKRWERYPGALLDGKTVGILGVGAIAEGLAPRCKAFGMRVVGISRTSRPIAGFDTIYTRAEIVQAAAELDYFVLLLPLEADTRNIVNDAVLSAMKPTAYLINLARGGVLDEDALIRALNGKKIAGAALDALATEPLPADSPLWTMPNVIITPHIGGFSDNYRARRRPPVRAEPAHFMAGLPDKMLHRAARS